MNLVTKASIKRTTMQILRTQILITAMTLISSNIIQAKNFPISENNHVTVDSVRLHYRTGGQGPYLLLLHGFTLSSEEWTEFFDDFSPNYTIIAFDLPGHGKSDRPDGSFSYNKWAELILKALDMLNIQSVKAIGHSAGAITLLHMAIMQPDALESMILIDGAHRGSKESKEELMADGFEKADSELQKYYLKIHHNDMDRISAIFEDIRDMAARYPVSSKEAEPILSKIKKVSIPVFLIWGDHDFHFPMDIVTELYLALPNSRLWVIPDQGHVPIWSFMGGDEQAADLFVEMAKEFLSEENSDQNN